MPSVDRLFDKQSQDAVMKIKRWIIEIKIKVASSKMNVGGPEALETMAHDHGP